ncbi:cGMP-dependent protein kinase 1 [Hondaea fermentalgiana]|uniref:cGMP-dependent protein kinase n=1 Tax=Hondaea fermentalgiana TaxID=2315210 RepID=A0A2R5GBG6_9STRA|nr:cGMP-dependent protein kinase 1 [Hondaea fermentalgiana]|eukprot:GBG25064.1 cGMP-dependent protein kinase 1 [Hondaea fermentalgiana]
MGCTQSAPEETSSIQGRKKNTTKSLASAPLIDESYEGVSGDQAPDTLRADSKIHLALSAKRRGDIFDESFQPDSKELKSYKNALVDKDEEVEELLKNALQNNILFRDLSDGQLTFVLNALTTETVEEGTEIIKEGDTGHVFFIVEEGSFGFEINGANVGSCGAGDSFGELALLYNCPRAATVRCLEEAQVWCLERATYRHIIAGNVAKKQQEIRKALRRVSLLQQLSEEQVNRVSDAVETVHFKAGETILRKGDEGSVFYMIRRGEVKCTRAGSRESSYDIILGEGEYFGERALLMDEPRAANVIALTDVDCLVLDREAFLSILGPLREALDSNLGMRVIGTIPMFSQLSEHELRKMMRALREERFKRGDVVIRQDDPGSKFYLIREGTAKVTKTVEGVRRGAPTDVAELSAGEYFGEGALLKDEPRAANVVATSEELVCLTMDRDAFEKLLGPLQKIMKRELDQRDDEINEVVKKQVALVEESLKLSDLKILQTLGTGTFGRVKLVSCEKLGRTYALKMLQKAQIVAYRQQKNVMNEKNILMECDHPFILKLYKTFRDRHSLYFLLEVVLGGELFTLLHIRGGALGNADARFYAACVLDAIEYLHSLSIVYRDLKPENLMISAEGYIKVVDFGFAKKVADKTYTLCGTPEYLAPELVLGKGHNKAVDNWAIGILIFEMLTGASPFADPRGGDHMVICKNIVRGKIDFPRRFPEKARDLVQQLLVRDAHQRLGSLVGGTAEIKEHPWFKSVDWNELRRMRLKAPWIPPIRDGLDTSNFDPYPEDDYVEPYKPTGTQWDADF